MADYPTFNINFVKIIENHPCLWNYSLTEYSKRNLTEKAWAEVANEVKDTVSNCRKRWRNIRGAFLRSIKKPPSGSGANAKKKYYLNEYLYFLLPYIKNKSSDGNLKSVSDCVDSSGDANSDSEDHTEHPMESQLDQGGQVSTVPSSVNSSIYITDEESTQDLVIDKSVIVAKNTCTKRKKSQNLSATLNPADDAFIKWMKYKQDRHNNSDSNRNEHPNMSFLHSLLPDMMQMTDKQNRRFRQKVIALIDDILEDKDIPSSHSLASNVSSISSYVCCPRPSPNESVQGVQCPMPSPNIPTPIPLSNAKPECVKIRMVNGRRGK